MPGDAQTELLFSVVIPVHNKGPHIARSVGSVLGQSFTDFELIVVDDDSTDESPQEIAKFTDPRLRTLHRAPAGPGPSGARNLGIRAATGRYVAFLDADDEWLPGFLAELKRMIDSGCDADVLATGHFVRYDGNSRPDVFSPTFSKSEPARLEFKEFVETWLRLGHCPVCSSAIAVRRTVLLDIGGFPEGWGRGEDKDTWLRAMRVGRLCYSPARLANYHIDSVNMITSAAPTEMSHRVCVTLEPWIDAETDPGLKRSLKRLYNHEIWNYARLCARHLRRGPDASGGFYPEADPLRYGAIQLLRLTPISALRAFKAVSASLRR